MLRFWPVLTLALLAAGCSEPTAPDDSPDASSPVDAGVLDGGVEEADAGASDGGQSDAGTPPDAGLVLGDEQEPNNGGTLTEVNASAMPPYLKGTINPADDVDVVEVQLTGGDIWTWKVEPPVLSTLAPHLSLTEEKNSVPVMVAIGSQGAAVEQEQFVLKSGKWFAIIRDARNVPASQSQHVGSLDHRWQLTATKSTRSPHGASFPYQRQGGLTQPFAIELYSFKLTATSDVEIELKARRKAAPSDLDTRLSLWDVGRSEHVITNDDLSGSTTDSMVGGTLPPGEFVVVVENVNPDADDLSYEIAFSLR